MEDAGPDEWPGRVHARINLHLQEKAVYLQQRFYGFADLWANDFSLALSIIYHFNLFSIEDPDAQNWNSILDLAMNLLDHIAICQIAMAYNDSIRLRQAIMKHVT
jgi:hypothetical protein